MRFDFKSFFPHVAAIAFFAALSIFYFSPQFSGKAVKQGDVIGYMGMSQELREYKETTGDESLWTNSMFGGMPSYQINTISNGNYTKRLQRALRLAIPPPAGQFIAAMVSFYILMILLGASPWLGVIGAIAFGFATNNLVLYEAGHESKLRAISYLPLIAAGLLLAFRKRYLLGGIVFGLGLAIDLSANHVQMTYYLFITFLIFGIAELVSALKKNEMAHFGRAALALTVGGILAIGTASSNLWVSYEYAKDTMRGEPILAQEAGSAPSSSSEVKGLEWGYAMQWSNNTLDLFSSFIPAMVGGGTYEEISSDSSFGKALKRLSARVGEKVLAPVYWGGLPSTSGPVYFGVIVFLFFMIGLFLLEGPVKWWLAGATLLTLILSMGHYFESINRLFFDYFPLYNKFRSPNSVLSVTTFIVVLMACLGLHELSRSEVDKERKNRALMLGGGIALGLCLVLALLGGSLFTFSNPADAGRLNQMFGGQLDQPTLNVLITSLEETRRELLSADAWRGFLFIALGGGLTYFFLENKIKLPIWLGGIALLTLVDHIGVGQRYLNKSDFESKTAIDKAFDPRPADLQILADPDPHYRVFDATPPSPFESATASYHHKTLNGYHAAKLQRFQDLITRQFSQGNQQVYDMFNTKYFIVPGPDGAPTPQTNPGAMGNAWIIDSIAWVQNANEEIDALGKLNLGNAAVVHEEYRDYLSGFNPNGQGSVTLSEYRPNKLTYSSNTSQEELVVFSEVWYGPNKGWQAYIDGEAVDHIRVNYALRAMKVPAGQHEIVFEFDPKAFQTGKIVAALSSVVLLLSLLAFIAIKWKNTSGEAPVSPPSPEKPKAKTTTKKKRKPRKNG